MVSAYFPPAGKWPLIVFGGLHLQKVGQPWGVASAKYGTSSLGENQGFGSPRTVHNMRPAGLSTTRSDSHPTRGEGFLLPIRASPPCYAETCSLLKNGSERAGQDDGRTVNFTWMGMVRSKLLPGLT